jgi:hypothetical protein
MTVARIEFSANGTGAQTTPQTKGKAKPKAHKPKPKAPTAPAKPAQRPRLTSAQVKTGATVTMGVVIPLLSLGLSHTGGTLLREGGSYPVTALALFSFLLMGCVLTVSLTHLAWAVEDLTRSPGWASWLLAVTFDLLLVLGELVHVAAEGSGAGAIVTAMMAGVCGLSMFLNVWAFLYHPTAPVETLA